MINLVIGKYRIKPVLRVGLQCSLVNQTYLNYYYFHIMIFFTQTVVMKFKIAKINKKKTFFLMINLTWNSVPPFSLNQYSLFNSF